MADDKAINKLARALVDELAAGHKVIATAESCTGGWIAKALTDVPGSSDVFHYGIVSYSNGAKESLLGVQLATLEEHGAVSEAVVVEMAQGALQLSGANIAVAVSGVAGPGGGSDAKPVGMVWFAWAVRDGTKTRSMTSCEQFSGDRELIRELTVVHALQGALERL